MRSPSRLVALFTAACLAVATGAIPALAKDAPSRSSTRKADPAKSKPAIGKAGFLPVAFGKESPASIADLKAMERQITNLVARVAPAVVFVQIGPVTGSGVVISEDGLVMTVAHVGERPNRDVRFVFPDGRSAKGKTLGSDHDMDSGLMKISDKGPWPHVTLGDLRHVFLGDWVLTMGHPGGYDPDRPIVARLGRVITLEEGMIRTDCTIMPGDSGGPLFDMHGRVIGIHSRISSATSENYHVPISAFEQSWTRLVKGETWGSEDPPPQPWIGVRGSDAPSGCRVDSVDPDGPASKAGLKPEDVITRLNGRKVTSSSRLNEVVLQTKPGTAVAVQVLRGGREMSFQVVVEEWEPPWR